MIRTSDLPEAALSISKLKTIKPDIMKKLVLLLLLVGSQSYGQNSAEMTLQTVEVNPELMTLMQFENILFDNLQFRGNAIRNKYYVLKMKEFSQGELVDTRTLFDERGNEYFRIDTTYLSFKFLNRIGLREMKVWLRGEKFGSPKSYFQIDEGNGRYAVKDFLGMEETLEVPTDRPFYIYAIITPYRNEDGSGSYCRVAQSEIDPENFGKEFGIPHYFLVEMEFISSQDGEGL